MLKEGDLVIVEHPVDMSDVEADKEYIQVVKITDEQVIEVRKTEIICKSGLEIPRYRIRRINSNGKLIEYPEYDMDKIALENRRLEESTNE